MRWCRGMDAVVLRHGCGGERHGCGGGMDVVVQRHGCGGAEVWMRW